MLAHRIMGAARVALRRASSLAPRSALALRPVTGLRSTLSALPTTAVRGLATKAKRSRSVKRVASASKSRRARSASKTTKKSAVARARSASARRATKKAKSKAVSAKAKAKAKAKLIAERRERKEAKHQEGVERRAARRAFLRDRRHAKVAREKEHKAIVRENIRARKLVKREKEDASRMFKRLRSEAANRGDPAKPARALTAYMLYHRSVFPAIYAETAKADKKTGLTVASKQIATQWKALSAEQKAPFEAESKALKEKAVVARAAYDASIPKQPLTAFFVFSNEKRAEVTANLPADVKAKPAKEQISAIGKELAAQWKALGEADKKRYADAYAAEKEKFEAAKEKYIASQLALLPAEFREMVRSQLPGRVSEVGAWVGRVRDLLARESSDSTDAATTKA